MRISWPVTASALGVAVLGAGIASLVVVAGGGHAAPSHGPSVAPAAVVLPDVSSSAAVTPVAPSFVASRVVSPSTARSTHQATTEATVATTPGKRTVKAKAATVQQPAETKANDVAVNTQGPNGGPLPTKAPPLVIPPLVHPPLPPSPSSAATS